MNTKLTHIFAFLSGAAIGSVVTWKLIKTKYEKIAQEEIDSVKEEFSKCKKEDKDVLENDENKDVLTFTKKDYEAYENIVRDNGYISPDTPIDKNEKGNSVGDQDCDFRVISPAEAGDEYDIETLTYYAGDHILTDEYDNIITLPYFNPEPYFGEFEDDAVHVRSDIRKVDYEILRDMRSYSDVMSLTSHKPTVGND